jgi:hypothetical protein
MQRGKAINSLQEICARRFQCPFRAQYLHRTQLGLKSLIEFFVYHGRVSR